MLGWFAKWWMPFGKWRSSDPPAGDGPEDFAGISIARNCPLLIAEFHKFTLTGSYRMMYIRDVR
jgi:hypothetical protein